MILAKGLQMWPLILHQSDMFRKIYFTFLILSFLPVLSCGKGNYLSSQVDIKMCGGTKTQLVDGTEARSTCIPPVVFYLTGSEKKKVICRRGLPDNFITPWDDEFLAQGRQEQTTDGSGSDTGEEARPDTIIHEIGGYWFKVFPVINNQSNYYLVVTDLNFKVRLGNTASEDKTFSDYCETNPYLYILDHSGLSTGSRSNRSRSSDQEEITQGSYTTYDQFDRAFVMGNLAFYVDELPEPPNATTSNDRFTNFRIPNYFVEWQMLGTFYTETGRQVGSFQKRGVFSTRRSSF